MYAVLHFTLYMNTIHYVLWIIPVLSLHTYGGVRTPQIVLQQQQACCETSNLRTFKVLHTIHCLNTFRTYHCFQCGSGLVVDFDFDWLVVCCCLPVILSLPLQACFSLSKPEAKWVIPFFLWRGSCGKQVSPLCYHSCKGVRTLKLCWTSNLQSSLGKRQPVRIFANLLHHSLSLAVGSNTIELAFSLVGKLAQGVVVESNCWIVFSCIVRLMFVTLEVL
jgi:hypothetical protein